MTFLLDVNVLIALLDPEHVSHDVAHHWFARYGRRSWATCPLTENGVIRVVSHASYTSWLGAPPTVARLVAQLRNGPGHTFWPDDISLLDSDRVDAARIVSSRQVTETYLLALALTHGGKLATFDRRLTITAVRGGEDGLHII